MGGRLSCWPQSDRLREDVGLFHLGAWVFRRIVYLRFCGCGSSLSITRFVDPLKVWVNGTLLVSALSVQTLPVLQKCDRRSSVGEREGFGTTLCVDALFSPLSDSGAGDSESAAALPVVAPPSARGAHRGSSPLRRHPGLPGHPHRRAVGASSFCERNFLWRRRRHSRRRRRTHTPSHRSRATEGVNGKLVKSLCLSGSGFVDREAY